MPFTKMSENMIDYFLNDLSLFQKKRTKTTQDNIDKILKILYNDIEVTSKYVDYLNKKDKLQFDFKEIINFNQLPKQELLSSKFTDKKCYDFIKNKIQGLFILSTNIQGVDITIYYGIFNKNDFNKLKKIKKYLVFALKLIRFCNLYKKNNKVKNIDIFLYLTPIKKELPKLNIDILSQENCNSAVTFACAKYGELLIYREEEWKKTLIHELFHSFCLDFSLDNNNFIKEKIKDIFPINSDFLISESYSEFWATILNSCFCAFSFLTKDEGLDDFILYAEFCIYIEKMFSLFQCIKILDFMNLKYDHLWLKDKISESYRNILYKENTNVFSYYILKLVLLNNSDDFFIWCYKNNTNILHFDSSEILFNKFYLFISKNYKSKFLLDNLKKMETKMLKLKNKRLLKTMKMTICDYKIN